MFWNMFDLLLLRRIACTQRVDLCGPLLHLSHVAWFLCLCVGWAVQNGQSDSDAVRPFGAVSRWPKEHCIKCGSNPPSRKAAIYGSLPVNKFRCFVQKAALARRDVAEISTTIIKLAASIAKSVKRRSGVCLSASLPVTRSVRWCQRRSIDVLVSSE